MQPPASLKALSDPIYEVFYGLTEQPFALTTDPRFFYLSASHQRAFTELLNGLRRRESLLMLTGDTGTGKTTLCRAVLHALGDRTFSAIILNPYMTGAEVLRIVLRDFGLVSHDELRRGGLAAADVAQLLDTLEGFLRALVPLGSHAVLVLDEAQSLTPAVLDQVRMLTGLEYRGQKLLQVVLCGQPGLQQTIKAEGLLALNERITRRIELHALPPEDIPGYIQHRLGVAGGAHSVRFDASAMQTVADLSRGLPRRINVLCDRALQEGRIEGVNVITADLVKRAARALAGVHEPLTPLVEPPVRPAVSSAPSTPIPAPTPAPAPIAPPPGAMLDARTVTTRRDETPAPSPVPVVPIAPSTPAPRSTTDARGEPTADASPAAPVAPAEPTRIVPAPAARPIPVVPAASTSPGIEAPPAAASPATVPSAATVMPAPPMDFLSEETPTPPRLPRPGLVQVQPAGAVATSPEVDVPALPPLPDAPVPVVVAEPEPAAVDATTPATPPVVADDASLFGTHARGELSFGQERPREGRLGRRLAVAAAVLAIVGGLGYASWSWDVRDSAGLIGPVPPRPTHDLGLEPAPSGIPPAELTDPLFIPRRIIPQTPVVVDRPELVDTPPEAAIPMAPDVMPTFPGF